MSMKKEDGGEQLYAEDMGPRDGSAYFSLKFDDKDVSLAKMPETRPRLVISKRAMEELEAVCRFADMHLRKKSVDELTDIAAFYFANVDKAPLMLAMGEACACVIAQKLKNDPIKEAMGVEAADFIATETRKKNPGSVRDAAKPMDPIHWTLQYRLAKECECINFVGGPCRRCLVADQTLLDTDRFCHLTELLIYRKFGRRPGMMINNMNWENEILAKRAPKEFAKPVSDESEQIGFDDTAVKLTVPKGMI